MSYRGDEGPSSNRLAEEVELKVGARKGKSRNTQPWCQEKGRGVSSKQSLHSYELFPQKKVIFNHLLPFPAQRKQSHLTTVPVMKEQSCFSDFSL